MGISMEFVLSEEGHTTEFVCKICLQLVEFPMYLQACHHVFCKSCIDSWFKTQESQGEPPVCPTCKSNASTGRTRALKDAEPLAWRVMGRIRVKCPLGRSSGCTWQGEYYSLENHLLSRELHNVDVSGAPPGERRVSTNAMEDDPPENLSEALKEQGNNKFQQGAYREAISLYSKAIQAAPKMPAYYANRAAAWLMLGANAECVKDCETALKLDPLFEKALVRLTKALCNLGDFAGAARASEIGLEELKKAGKDTSALQQERQIAKELHDCEAEATRCLSQDPLDPMGALVALQYAMKLSSSSKLVVMAAKAEISLGRAERAISMLMPVLKAEPGNASAYMVRGLALFLRGDFDQALKHEKEALKLDPDSPNAHKVFQSIRKTLKAQEEAKALFLNRKFSEAEVQYSEALLALTTLLVPAPLKPPALQAELLADRASCFLRMDKFPEALADAEASLAGLDDCRKAHVVRASALTKMGRPEEAVQLLKEVMKSYGQGDTELRGALDRATFEVRKLKRPDYYGVLGVPSVASTIEIKRAYKQRALDCNPDKYVDQGQEAHKRAEEQFAVLQDALQVLTENSMSRKLYDEGFDKEAIRERLERAQRAARDY